jgi:hypothetical protein
VPRAFLRLACLVASLGVVGCGSSTLASRTSGPPARVFRDALGWAVDVPSGWHVIRFTESKGAVTAAGAEFSNVPLAVPSLVPGNPVQVNGRTLPASGVSLVISTDADPRLTHGTLALPPLPAPGAAPWTIGSASAGEPYLNTLWFGVKRATLIASAKIGSQSNPAALKALAAIVRSLRQF